MLLIPAIDLKDGKCVRLRQGAMDQVTRYSDDPVGMAAQWQNLGATYLHVVDLDGAVTGSPQHLPHIEAIAKRLQLPATTEITLEANPTSVEAGRFAGFRDAGVNRVSVGVQSLRNIPGNPEVGGTAFGPGYARLVDAANKYGYVIVLLMLCYLTAVSTDHPGGVVVVTGVIVMRVVGCGLGLRRVGGRGSDGQQGRKGEQEQPHRSIPR